MTDGAAPPAWLSQLPPTLKVRRLLGRGAFGEVYEAQDTSRGALVALKVLTAELEPKVVRRFLREAEVLRQISHPHVLRFFAQGQAGPVPFLVLELLDGTSLKRPPPGVDPLALMLPIAGALEHVHAQGVIHRDVKPDNILWTSDGRAVLVDFGLVTRAGATQLTRTGAVVGSLGFLSPELLRGRPHDSTSDFWAWAVTLFDLCEKRLPYGAEDLHGVIAGQPLRVPTFQRLGPSDPERRILEAFFGRDIEARPRTLAQLEQLAAGTSTPAPPALGTAALGGPGALGNTALFGDTSGDLATAGPAGDAAASPRRRTGPIAGAAFLAALAFGAWTASPGRPPAPPEATAPATPEPPGERFGEEFVARVRFQLDALEPCSGAGDDAKGAAWVPCPDRDPRRWGQVLELLPAASELEAWVLEGGHPEELPPRVRARLKGAAAAFSRRGLPSPFCPWDSVEPHPLSGTALTDLLEGLQEEFRVEDFPASIGPWLGSALLAAQQVVEARRRLPELDRLHEVGDLARQSLLGKALRVDRRFELSYSRRPFRTRAARFMAEGNEAVLRLVYAAGRATREPPPAIHPEHQGLLAKTLLNAVEEYWYGPQAFAHPHRLLGIVPRTPPEHALAAKLAYHLRAPRRWSSDLGPSTPDLQALLRFERAALEAAQVEDGVQGKWARRRRRWSRVRLGRLEQGGAGEPDGS